MAENSGIEWTHHTFNPWIGCTKVSPGCDHCYAEALSTRRLGVAWGPHAERRRTAESTWRLPLRWNARAAREGRRERVFCASLADVFDNQVPDEWRADLWRLIRETPHLDWLLLTKRPQNIARMLPPAELQDEPWPWGNVWLGTTVENQAEADRRIPHLLAAPAAVRFLSCEPLLGPVDLEAAWHGESALGGECWGDCKWCANGHPPMHNCQRGQQSEAAFFSGRSGLDWVIAGGESGPGARPMHPDWARSLRDQCAAAGVPFFFKQWGEFHPADQGGSPEQLARHGSMGHALRDGRAVAFCDQWTWRVGKKAAGRLLDGRMHDEVPRG